MLHHFKQESHIDCDGSNQVDGAVMSPRKSSHVCKTVGDLNQQEDKFSEDQARPSVVCQPDW